VDHNNPRLTYTLEWTLRGRLGIDFKIQEIHAENAGDQRQGFDGVMYYSSRDTDRGALFLAAEGLLQEKGIRFYAENNPGSPWTGCLRRLDAQGISYPAIFPTEHELGHDPLAGIFWMLSRYEEYQRTERDSLGRFPVTASWLAREGVLEMPLADLYVQQLGHWLSKNLKGYRVPGPARVVQPTVDVDLCYSYLGKPLYRQIGGWWRDIFRGKWRDAGLRIRVLMGLAYDPYDRYAALQDLHRRWEAASPWCRKPLYFFLMADYGGLDQGHSPQSPYLHRVIRFLVNTGAVIGWHPSLRSNSDQAVAFQEKKSLEVLVGKISASRQHYLALNFPVQAERLHAMEIRSEHSMGYAERPGFKAGTLHPFGFYDLAREQELPLFMFPVPAMDATLRHHLRLDPEQAWERIQPLLNAWEQYGGYFTLLWHNSTVDSPSGGSYGRERWQDFYQKCYERVLGLDRVAKEEVEYSEVSGACDPEELLEGPWTVHALTAPEREGWDAVLPPSVTVYHCKAYLDHRLGKRWALLLSPNQRWALPVPGGLKHWVQVLRQPLMVQHYRLLRVEFREGQVRPSLQTGMASAQVYASLIKALDRRYQWVDWQLDCHSVPETLDNLLPGPRWSWVAKPSYIISVKSSAEEQWKSYNDHHRRYLRNPVDREALNRLGWDFVICSSWDQAVSLPGLEHCLDLGLQSKVGWNRPRIHKAKGLIRTMLSGKKCTIFALCQSGKFLSATVLWHSGSTLIYQFAWDSPRGRPDRAAMHLVHAVLGWARTQCNADGKPTYQFLDMEGSEIPGIQRFYAGFGGKPRIYWRIIKRLAFAKA
jgi:hypothetical protein